MKASEVVEKLQELIAANGDHEVKTGDPHAECNSATLKMISGVYFEDTSKWRHNANDIKPFFYVYRS